MILSSVKNHWKIIRKRSKTLHIHYHTLRKSPWILPSHNRSWRSDFSIKAMVVKWWLRWSCNHELVNNQSNCAFLLYHCIVIIFIRILLMLIKNVLQLKREYILSWAGSMTEYWSILGSICYGFYVCFCSFLMIISH